ncbi:Hpt domain-containing protein [Phenylobacterium sp.]|uniref:Hpt domain-containing protein n=1 Tax=Phenylobacterium sp. TaxID=1871053 RepID=UPI00286B81D5|nr:Hpt domain-containing protein [Phenylobacterium sp.]
MPSGAVDFGYLEGFAAGDLTVVREVLAIFAQQAKAWGGALDAGDPGWRDVVHTIKGAARGVGANALGEVCAVCEAAGEGDLPAVREALTAAVADIAAYLARPQAP